MRVGVLGGTFDPIHLGHLAAARAAIDCAELDRVILVPAGTPPHRRPAVADAAERLEMCRLAVDGDTALEVSEVETRRSGPSFTSDTLRELKQQRPGDELFLVLGWDAARMFATWHEPEEVRRLASVIVVSRPKSGSPDEGALRAAGLDPAQTIVCVRPTPDISGSALRRAIANGEAVSDLPEAVQRYIAKNRLYMDNREVG
jgi:nicotinate-nucleotide adenylyltransferase